MDNGSLSSHDKLSWLSKPKNADKFSTFAAFKNNKSIHDERQILNFSFPKCSKTHIQHSGNSTQKLNMPHALAEMHSRTSMNISNLVP